MNQTMAAKKKKNVFKIILKKKNKLMAHLRQKDAKHQSDPSKM